MFTYPNFSRGPSGDCTGPLAIPPDAVAVDMDVTAVNPTAQSNLKVFPADVATVPAVSNLNSDDFHGPAGLAMGGIEHYYFDEGGKIKSLSMSVDGQNP